MIGAVEGGGTWFRWAVGERAGEWSAQGQLATGSPDETLDAVAHALAPHRPRIVGVATFGPIRLDGPHAGTTLATPKAGWDDVPVGARLGAALGVPVIVETDVGAAALAEWRLGAARGADPCVYVTVGTGVGFGVSIGGRVHHGALHPEAGHLPVRRQRTEDGRLDDFAGTCRFHGACLEGLISGPAIAARAAADAETLAPDHPALAIAADYLGVGLVAAVLLLAPRRLVVGGGVGTRPGFLARARERLGRELAGYPPLPDLAPAALGAYLVSPGLHHSGLVGAGLLAEDSLIAADRAV